MYTLFNDSLVGFSLPKITFPNYEYAKKGLSQDLDFVIKHHRNNPRAVRSNHFLVKILHTLNVSLSLDVNIYRDRVEEVSENVAMALNMTSSLYKGKMFYPGIFYGQGSGEITIAHAEDFDLNWAIANWEELEPVKFLYHPKTDLGMDIPNGYQTGSEEGTTVLLVNIPMLAVQYRLWREREEKLNSENQRTVMQFIHMYPLANSLRSQLDIALLNRFMAVYDEIPRTKSSVKKPFVLTDWTDRIDKSFDQLADYVTTKALTYDELLNQLTLVSSRTARDVVRIPKMPMTRQVVWALAMSRLRLISFLAAWSKGTRNQRNRQSNGMILKECGYLLNDNAFKDALPKYFSSRVEMEIKNIIIPLVMGS